MPFDSAASVCGMFMAVGRFQIPFILLLFLFECAVLFGWGIRAQSTRIALIVGIIYYNPPDYKSERERRRRTKDKRNGPAKK